MELAECPVVQPVYYDYGTNLYYEGDNVYYDGEVVATTEQYAQQAQEIAANIPDVQPDKLSGCRWESSP